MKKTAARVLHLLVVASVFTSGAAAAEIAVGKIFPDDPPLRVVDLDGREVTFQDRILPTRHDGRATLVVFWATWCEPCIKEIPEIQQLDLYYGRRGLRVVSLGLNMGGDTVDRLAAATVRHEVDYLVLFDQEGSVQSAFGIEALPMSALIDGKGVVVWKGLALPRDINDKIRAALAPEEDRGSE